MQESIAVHSGAAEDGAAEAVLSPASEIVPVSPTVPVMEGESTTRLPSE